MRNKADERMEESNVSYRRWGNDDKPTDYIQVLYRLFIFGKRPNYKRVNYLVDGHIICFNALAEATDLDCVSVGSLPPLRALKQFNARLRGN